MRYPSSWAITGDIMIRICKTCKKEFTINQWQKNKVYCSGPCSGGSFSNWVKKKKAKK